MKKKIAKSFILKCYAKVFPNGGGCHWASQRWGCTSWDKFRRWSSPRSLSGALTQWPLNGSSGKPQDHYWVSEHGLKAGIRVNDFCKLGRILPLRLSPPNLWPVLGKRDRGREGSARGKGGWVGWKAAARPRKCRKRERAWRQQSLEEKNIVNIWHCREMPVGHLEQNNQSYWMTGRRCWNNCKWRDWEFPVIISKAW